MYASNMTKKGNKAFSYTCFAHTYRSPYLRWCQAAWAPCYEWKLFFIKHELLING